VKCRVDDIGRGTGNNGRPLTKTRVSNVPGTWHGEPPTKDSGRTRVDKAPVGRAWWADEKLEFRRRVARGRLFLVGGRGSSNGAEKRHIE